MEAILPLDADQIMKTSNIIKFVLGNAPTNSITLMVAMLKLQHPQYALNGHIPLIMPLGNGSVMLIAPLVLMNVLLLQEPIKFAHVPNTLEQLEQQFHKNLIQ